ncbi:MAG: molybdopterin cofactor-binding domain-containing protein, partial [Flavobacteriaceae bacterium]
MKADAPRVVADGVHKPVAHDSATRHVTGEARYIDDIAEPRGLLHVALGLSEVARARILSLDLSGVEAFPGVVAVLTARDVPGENDISPVGKHDEPIFPEQEIAFHGQPLFAVVAESRDIARRAARLAKVRTEALPPVLDLAEARGGRLVTEPLELRRGDPAPAIEAAPHRISGTMAIGGQDHFYLEGQIALAAPGEDGEMHVWSSTQHPSETQHMVAHALAVTASHVTVEVRRMGGGFGGKETQANIFAVNAALAARRTGRPCKLRPDRDEDMLATGKRHDMLGDYRAGVV